MKSVVITTLLIICGGLVTAQSTIQEASKLYQEGAYQKSAEMYTSALKSGEGSTTDFYNAACSWALAGNQEKGMEYLLYAMEKGWTNTGHLQRDTDLTSLHAHPDWDKAVGIAEKNLKAYEATLNIPVKTQLERLYLKDQTLRQLYREAEEKFGRGSDEMNYFWEVVNAQDRKNEAEVEELIKEHGWVGISEVGGKANAAIWLVIQHAPIEMQQKYLPLLRESAKKGESKGSHLAMLEDRILMRTDKPQIYGSQIWLNPETGEQEVYEVEDPGNINERRASVGLGPIEDYVKQFGLTWE